MHSIRENWLSIVKRAVNRIRKPGLRRRTSTRAALSAATESLESRVLLSASTAFVRGDGPVTFADGEQVVPAQLQLLQGDSLSVSITSNAHMSDQLTIANSGSISIDGAAVSFSDDSGTNVVGHLMPTASDLGGSNLTISLETPHATREAVEALVSAITFNNMSTAPSALIDTGNQIWHQDLGGVKERSETADAFGAALVTGDFDGDGFDDQAVGVPGESIAGIDGGAVSVFYGSETGLERSRDALFHQNRTGMIGSVEPDDGFGQALASGDFNNDGYDDLVIGIPGETVQGVANGGAVSIVYGSSIGLTLSGHQYWHPNSPGVEGAAERNDGFGEVLAAGDFDNDGFDDLVVGIPGKDINGAVDAGAVQILFGSLTGLISDGNQLWSQQTGGVAEQSEVGDRFGSALAVEDFNGDGIDDLAVGVPGESIGPVAGSGAVNVFYGTEGSGLPAIDNQFWHQNRSNVLGASQANDNFGAALAAGDFDRDGYGDLAIGVPNETIRGKVAAGAVNILYGGMGVGLDSGGNQYFHQDRFSMEDEAEAGDLFGSSLAAADFDGDGTADLAIGIHAETINGHVAAGAVSVVYGRRHGGLTATGNQFWHQGQGSVVDRVEAGDHFGRSLAAGDFNGDGAADLSIGVPTEGVRAVAEAGAVNVLYGSGIGGSREIQFNWNHENGPAVAATGAETVTIDITSPRAAVAVEDFGVSTSNTAAQNSIALQKAINETAAVGLVLEFHGDYTFAANTPAARVLQADAQTGLAAAVIASGTKIDFGGHTQTVTLSKAVDVDRVYFLSGSEQRNENDVAFRNGFINNNVAGSAMNLGDAPLVVLNLFGSDGVEIENIYAGPNGPKVLLFAAGSHNGRMHFDNPLTMKLGWFAYSEHWTVGDLVIVNEFSDDEIIDLDKGNSDFTFGTIQVTDTPQLLREIVEINGSSNISIKSIETDGPRAIVINSKATFTDFTQYQNAVAGNAAEVLATGLPVENIHVERIVVDGQGRPVTAVFVGNSKTGVVLFTPRNISFGSIDARNVDRGLFVREAEDLSVGSLTVRNAIKGLVISVPTGSQSTFIGTFGLIDVENTQKNAIDLNAIEFIEIDVVRIANHNLDGLDDDAIKISNLLERDGVVLIHDGQIL